MHSTHEETPCRKQGGLSAVQVTSECTPEHRQSHPFGCARDISNVVRAERLIVEVATRALLAGELMYADTLREASSRCAVAIEAFEVRSVKRDPAPPLAWLEQVTT